jgi:hypothetical protein
MCRVPTPDWTRNISWYQFYKYNLSYLHISEFSYMNLDYRQNHYAFWRDYFPSVSARRPGKSTRYWSCYKLHCLALMRLCWFMYFGAFMSEECVFVRQYLRKIGC